jgi:tRNA 2-selenouridine synthase
VDSEKKSGLHPLGWSPLTPQEFLEQAKSFPVIDVRAPKEFAQGHIPGAISMPLFDDEERAVVGITYTKTGNEAAVLKGLEITGPKLARFVMKAKEIAGSGGLLVHCWRGGMRSGAMAWLFDFAGIKTSVLHGGYRAYRQFIRESFLQGPEVIVLGGMTGSGKTQMLHHLSSIGEQVLDLEGLACHKGSAFGSLGQSVQPTTEQFENDLALLWHELNPEKPVWLEDESLNIGKVIIPEPLFARMNTAPVVYLDVPFNNRVERLSAEYGNFDPIVLKEIIIKISRRMGGDRVNDAIRELETGNIQGAVSAVLTYYDKTYSFGLSKREKSKIHFIKAGYDDLEEVVRKIVNLELL